MVEEKSKICLKSGSTRSIPFAGVDEIFATVCKEMLLAGDIVLSGGRRCGLSGVHIQAVLALFGEAYRESDHVVIGDGVRYVFRQPLLLDAVLV